MANNGSGNVSKLTSAGTSLGTFAVGTHPRGIAIDASGNLWVGNFGDNTVTEFIGVTAGQFFPYSGPIFPGGF